MNFVTFPVSGTNIFPISNSKLGGQLLTEFNLRSIDTVATPSNLSYSVGPSFVHGKNDFDVQIQQDSSGNIINADTLEILPGRAVVNGHYIETFAPMTISLQEANAKLKREGYENKDLLVGELAIGIKICYSTLPTMAYAMLTENGDNMYEGVQLVVLPASELITPFDGTDKCQNINNVTAHLRLATFKYYNGNIVRGSVNNNPNKWQYIDGERVGNISHLLSDMYLSRVGVQPDHLYVLSGKGKGDDEKTPYWCQATRSLMAWDKGSLQPMPTTPAEKKKMSEQDTASFVTNSLTGKVSLRIPHMQVDGMTTKDANGNEVDAYYEAVNLPLPVANYDEDTSGTVDKTFIRRVKRVESKLQEYYNFATGKQRMFIEILHSIDDLPAINPNWSIGDYVVVGQDMTLSSATDTTSQSTMYIVSPGLAKSVRYHSVFIETVQTYVRKYHKDTEETESNQYSKSHFVHPVSHGSIISGVGAYVEAEDEYGNVIYIDQKDPSRVYCDLMETPILNQFSGCQLGTYNIKEANYLEGKTLISGEVSGDEGQPELPNFINAGTSGYYKRLVKISEDSFEYVPKDGDMDYFNAYYYTSSTTSSEPDDKGIVTETTKQKTYTLFYTIASADKNRWSAPVQLTAEIPYATETVIGGFLNVNKDKALDGGYIYRDDNGYLRLVDYNLLRQGTLAYQLGEDIALSSGVDTEEVNLELTDYVNERIAFPNDTQKTKEKPNVINIRIELPEEDEGQKPEYTIQNIDSRFGTSIYLHFTGKATSKSTVNIVNCEKVRIESNLSVNSGNCPTINLIRSNLYYDPSVIDYIRKSGGTIHELGLWHERFDSGDPGLIIEGLKVSRSPKDIIQSNEVDYWNADNPNSDNHLFYAVRSLTFSEAGEIVDFEMLIGNDSTYTDSPNPEFTILNEEFKLPQQPGLAYPVSAMTHKLSIDGNFVSAYKPSDASDWVVSEVSFSGKTGQYIDEDTGVSNGTIAFLIKTHSLPCDTSSDVIEPWSSKTYHIAEGGAI